MQDEVVFSCSFFLAIARKVDPKAVLSSHFANDINKIFSEWMNKACFSKALCSVLCVFVRHNKHNLFRK